eukprot:7994183-Alexandrium_andersonii.AAC.1
MELPSASPKTLSLEAVSEPRGPANRALRAASHALCTAPGGRSASQGPPPQRILCPGGPKDRGYPGSISL